MMRRLLRPFLLLSLAVLAVTAGLACDSATPTAPAGTILTISANPSQIGLTGTSSITVLGRRPDGNPLNEGTEILFSTDLGDISPSVVPVDEDGVARATLRGDGRLGTASVTARLTTSSGGGGEEGGGGGTGSVSVDVVIGRNAGSVSIQATPSSVEATPTGESGEAQVVQLLALVRDSSGQPLPGVPVNFQTELGTLASGGRFLNTNARGEAEDTLTITPDELSAVNTDSFEVGVEASAEAGGEGGGGTIEATFSIRIDRPLRADFFTSQSGLTVSFTDQSTGNPTSWNWTFGEGGASSTQQNPSFTYNSAGEKTVSLTVRNARGSDTVERTIEVTQ